MASEIPADKILRRRDWSLPVMIAVVGAASILFYFRQNRGRRIGGRMSFPKLLWLDYALSAWFILPFAFCRSPRIVPVLRRIYGAHLACFGVRAVVELWLLYVTRSWIPPYGIAHDSMAIVLITSMLQAARGRMDRPLDLPNRAALRFLGSIRLGLVCEMVFAWLFYQAVHRDTSALWFAANEPRFLFINGLTWAVVIPAYLDLGRTLRRGSEALFLVVPPADGAA